MIEAIVVNKIYYFFISLIIVPLGIYMTFFCKELVIRIMGFVGGIVMQIPYLISRFDDIWLQ